MAAELLERDPINKRIWAMGGACGLQWRSNVVEEVGGKIPFHAHDKPHWRLVISGVWQQYLRAPDGTETLERCGPGSRFVVEAGWYHEYTLLEGSYAEIICVWPEEEIEDGSPRNTDQHPAIVAPV